MTSTDDDQRANTQVVVLPASAAHAERIAELSGELGYPATKSDILRRLEIAEELRHSVVFVAIVDDNVIGWIQVALVAVLTSGLTALIVGLVVDERHRGEGIGRILVDASETWAVERGAREIRVRSQTVRVRTHAFYRQLGFEHIKTQHVFVRKLEENR